MLTLSLLVSGALGLKTLQTVIDRGYPISAVFTNRNSNTIIDCCQESGLPCFVGNPRGGKAKDFIAQKNCDVLLSVNYLFLIEKDLIEWPRQYAINIHGSLLPKYRGRTPHVWAIINGERETGITAHLIDEEVDRGAILRQIHLPIEEEDTGGSILLKFQDYYPRLVMELLEDVQKGSIQKQSQDAQKAIYFGKRTPDDGQIDWTWSRERIRNWIRAQAHPYPGAFTFHQQEKITVHRAQFDDHGFHQNQPDGYILDHGPQYLVVKTPNGALRLEEIISEKTLYLQRGSQLN
ncbi:MAG: methionyl-tRNA formyltransferase [Bacteroidota bacterium]